MCIWELEGRSLKEQRTKSKKKSNYTMLTFFPKVPSTWRVKAECKMKADMMLLRVLPISSGAHAEVRGEALLWETWRNTSTWGQANITGRYQNSPNAGENGAGGRWPHSAERTSVQAGNWSPAKPGPYCKNPLNRGKIGARATGTQKLEEQEEPRVHVRQQWGQRGKRTCLY